jgi:uncharacterized protein YhaN
MFLVELVMQGIRGFRELARLRFQSGFNLIAAGNEAGKTAAVDSMQRLLFPVDQPSRMASLISRAVPDASRGALVVYGDDGGYYRLIQDFSKRAVNLSKYNPATKEFSLMYKTWESAVPFMAGLTAGITEEEYARIFIIRRDQRAASAASRPAAPVAAPHPVHQPAAKKSGKAAASEARLAELRETLRKAEEAADAEYRMQSGKLRLDEIRKKLESLDEIDNKYTEMEARLEELKGCATLPPNLAELIDAHVEQQGKKMADSDDLHEQIAQLKAQLGSMPVANLFADKLFIAGAAVAVLSFIAALAVLTPEQDYFFPLGILVAAILIVAAWYNSTRRSAQRKVVQKEIGALEADRTALEKSFEQGGAAIVACMKSTGSKTTEELKDKVDNYRHFLSLRDEIAEQQQRIYGGVTHKALLEDYQNQQLEVIELEKAARAVAQYAVDTYSIRQDIERIESELPTDGSSSASSWDAGAPDLGDFGSPDFGTVAPGGTGFLAELGIASRIGAIEMETLIPAVEAAAQRNLTAVTAGKYVRIEIAGDAGPVVHAKDDTAVQASDLSPSTQELISFCIRTGIVEALAGKRRLPLLLDDPLAGFDPMRQKAACQVLRSLGTRTQVILFASNPELKTAGDVFAELK